MTGTAPGKRRKDAAIGELREALERVQDLAEAYRSALEAELSGARAEPQPYEHLVRALERQIASVRTLEETLDERVWPELIALANGSAYIAHTRTRDFF